MKALRGSVTHYWTPCSALGYISTTTLPLWLLMENTTIYRKPERVHPVWQIKRKLMGTNVHREFLLLLEDCEMR